MDGTVHFIGIGGAGMSGLARLLLARGERVSGSDLRPGPALDELRALGARVSIGHRAENLNGATRVVYSAAVREDNPELAEARRRRIPTVVRARLLGELMADRRGIAVTGTHGKTTSTGMAGSVFLSAGLDPTVLVGGEWSGIGGNARPGNGPHFLAEACEAFQSFLEMRPAAALVTNIEEDHLDCYEGSMERLLEAFRTFFSRIPEGGYVVGCGEDANVRRLLGEMSVRSLLYGWSPELDYSARGMTLDGGLPHFRVFRGGEELGEVRLSVPGRHNALNALGVAALATEEGVPFPAVAGGLAAFRGVERRFELLGEANGVLVVDDYAHHPTELRATLAAARERLGRPLLAVFQPHLYSRTAQLMDEFAGAFEDADRVLITGIYGAREDPLPGITAEALAAAVRARRPGIPVAHRETAAEALEWLRRETVPGEAVLTLGAGDVRGIGEAFLAAADREPAGTGG